MNAAVPSYRPAAVSRTPREALAQALRRLDEAELDHRPLDMTRALAQVGRCYGALGETAAAEWYLQQALRWARVLNGGDHAVDLLGDLAEVAATVAQEALAADDPERARAARDRARDHAFEAAVAVRLCADAARQATVLQRVARVLAMCGDQADAAALQERADGLLAGQRSADVAAPRAAA